MKNAKQLLEGFTAFSFRDPQRAAEMFTDDGAFEMPYLESVGFPGRYEGHEQIRAFFAFVREIFPDMEFHDTKVVCEQADGKVVVAEYKFTCRSTKTGRMIHQLFIGRLEAESGRIKLLRESINLVELGRAIYQNGLADLRVADVAGSSEGSN
jgi:uncharacterized protein